MSLIPYELGCYVSAFRNAVRNVDSRDAQRPSQREILQQRSEVWVHCELSSVARVLRETSGCSELPPPHQRAGVLETQPIQLLLRRVRGQKRLARLFQPGVRSSQYLQLSHESRNRFIQHVSFSSFTFCCSPNPLSRDEESQTSFLST